jgi:alkylation response protein AidB-like acyl-CoA dehydrogenase
VRPLVQLDGDSDFGEVFFEDVFIPTSALVGESNKGWSYAMHTLSSERGSLVLRRTADLAVVFSDLVEELTSGGKGIGERDLHRIGSLRARLFALESQCERIVDRMLDAPDTPSAHDSFDKAFMTGFEQEMLGFAEECLGAYSHIRDRKPGGLNSSRWIHDYYYGRAASIYGGTAQVQRNIIAERHLGLPKEPR